VAAGEVAPDSAALACQHLSPRLAGAPAPIGRPGKGGSRVTNGPQPQPHGKQPEHPPPPSPNGRHVELDGNEFPFSRGVSFYEVNEQGQIIFARDIVEPTIKPGAAALQVRDSCQGGPPMAKALYICRRHWAPAIKPGAAAVDVVQLAGRSAYCPGLLHLARDNC
jgi:hypothetical protein